MARVDTAIPQAGQDLLDLVSVRALAKSGEALEIRRRSGLSLADIGGAVGVAAATISRWENGERKPFGDAAIRYLRLLNALQRQLRDGQ